MYKEDPSEIVRYHMCAFSLMGGGHISNHVRSDMLLPIDGNYSEALVSTSITKTYTCNIEISHLVGKPTMLLCGFRTGLTQIRLHSHRSKLEA